MLKKTALSIFLALFVISSNVVTVFAGPQEDLEAVKKKLAEIRNQKSNIEKTIKSNNSLQNQYNAEIIKLKNQIDLLDTQIQEKELVIQELTLQIEIVSGEINQTDNEIQTAKVEIQNLEYETDNRIIDIYISEKTFSQVEMILSDQTSNVVKYSIYQNALQRETLGLLNELNEKREELQVKIKDLEEKKLVILKDKTQIDEEKLALSNNQNELEQQRSVYYRKKYELAATIDKNNTLLKNLTNEEKIAYATQEKLEQQLFNNVSNIANGSYVLKGTIIAQQGCTGFCTGPHVHFSVAYNGKSVNPCSVVPSGKFSNCGGSGALDWPLRGSFYFTSSYGWRSWTNSFHDAIDIAHSTSNAPVYAAHDGWLQKGRWGCRGSGCRTSYVNYAIICEKSNCSQGYKTLYLHLR